MTEKWHYITGPINMSILCKHFVNIFEKIEKVVNIFSKFFFSKMINYCVSLGYISTKSLYNPLLGTIWVII